MAEHGEPQVPDDPQRSSAPSGENQESHFEYVEVHLEFQQRLPGGLFRSSWRYVRRRNRAKETRGSRISPRSAIILIVFFTIVIIGLIAVGPQGVWEEIKSLLSSLFDS